MRCLFKYVPVFVGIIMGLDASATVINVPGRINAESYKDGGEGVGYHDTTVGNLGGEGYRADDVDIIRLSPYVDPVDQVTFKHHAVTDIEDGEWLAYDVHFPTNGNYMITGRVKGQGVGSFHLEIDGVDVSGPISVPDTSAVFAGHQVLEVGLIPVTAGDHALKLVFDEGGFDCDWLHVKNTDIFLAHPVGFGAHLAYYAGTTYEDRYTKLNNFVDSIDLDFVVNEYASMGVTRVDVSIGQNTGFYNSPNSYYSNLMGYAPGEFLSNRDIPLEFSTKLAAKGIKTFIYVPCRPGYSHKKNVPQWRKDVNIAFGFDPDQSDANLNHTNCLAWAEVLKEWSLRYGSNVSGWWIDGFYAPLTHFEVRQDYYYADIVFEVYYEALKAGNRMAQVTFKGSDWDDYEDGESGHFFRYPLGALKGRYWNQEDNNLIPCKNVGRQFTQYIALDHSWKGMGVKSRDSWVNYAQFIINRREHQAAMTVEHGAVKPSDPDYNPVTRPVGALPLVQKYSIESIMNMMALPVAPEPEAGQKVHTVAIDFEEDFSDHIVEDQSGYGNHAGFLYGMSLTPVAGHTGNGVYFDGIDDAMAIGAKTYSASPSFTTMFWAKPSVGEGGYQRVVDTSGIHKDGYSIAIENGVWKLRLQRGDDVGPGFDEIATTAQPMDTWVHVAARYDADTGNATIFINGTRSQSGAASYNNHENAAQMVLGRGNKPGSAFYCGGFDDLRVYNYALSDQRINAIANGQVE